MVKSKFVRVLDEGTDMVFIITKFEPSDTEFLALKGWKYTPDLTIMTSIGNKVASSISKFNHPPYDIEERSENLGYSHTTHALAKVVRGMNFDEIPDMIDVEDIDCTT